jgi:uncharacterized protein YggE
MKKVTVSIALFLLIIFLSFNAFAAEDIRKITVTGKSEITVEIKQVNKEMSKSYSELSNTIAKLTMGLNSVGLTNKEIKKSLILQGQEYAWELSSNVFKGYYSKCIVTINVNDISKMPGVYQELSNYKNITIRSTDYKRNDEFDIREKEFDKALQAAKKKAEHMAQVLNVKIGKVHSIQELSSEYSSSRLYSNFAVAEKQAVSDDSGFGTIKIVATVMVEFELE